MKEERQRKKERKRNKKAKMEKDCLTFQKMNCFSHDSNHWRTPPLWTEPSFCFCMNANNNTYSCLRTINQTHNFLYCEFTTGLVTFYNLKKGIIKLNVSFNEINLILPTDPFETQNLESSLTPSEKSHLHDTLEHMKGCRGRNCVLQRKGSQLIAGQAVVEQQLEIVNSSLTFRGNSKRKHNNNIGLYELYKSKQLFLRIYCNPIIDIFHRL